MAESTDNVTEPGASARCWATHTDLAGSEMERKKYYLIIEDKDKPDLNIIVVRGPGAAISVEPYVTHEYDYDDFDSEEEEDDDEDYYYEEDDEEEKCFEANCEEAVTVSCQQPGCSMTACSQHPLTCILCEPVTVEELNQKLGQCTPPITLARDQAHDWDIVKQHIRGMRLPELQREINDIIAGRHQAPHKEGK